MYYTIKSPKAIHSLTTVLIRVTILEAPAAPTPLAAGNLVPVLKKVTPTAGVNTTFPVPVPILTITTADHTGIFTEAAVGILRTTSLLPVPESALNTLPDISEIDNV